jgi:hypothetical protein
LTPNSFVSGSCFIYIIYFKIVTYQEEFEDYQRGNQKPSIETDRQSNGQKKKDKRKINDLQNTTHKIKEKASGLGSVSHETLKNMLNFGF